jgi:hypothetical protein
VLPSQTNAAWEPAFHWFSAGVPDLLLGGFEIPLNPVDSDGEYVNGVHRVPASKGMNTPLAKMMNDGLLFPNPVMEELPTILQLA